MFALVESGSITKFFKGNKGLSIGDTQYPKQIFQWSNEELQAIGIYPVRIDTTNKKDENYYINTNIDYTIQDNEVVGSYGTATAKLLEDRNEVNDDDTPMLDSEGNQVRLSLFQNYPLKQHHHHMFLMLNLHLKY